MSEMLAAIRLKGTINRSKKITDTLNMLGLKKPNTVAILPKTDSIKGMLRKAEGTLTWGEADEEIVTKIKKIAHLKPPKGGFKSIKMMFPRGDLGYRGVEINKLIKRMM